MLGLEMLDVAIGVIFIYLLLSIFCTALNEGIENFLKLRAVDLEQGIRELLNDPDGSNLVKKLYNHQLIFSLFRGDYSANEIRNVNDANAGNKKKRYSRGSDLPSYIPARNFALALMDIVLPSKAATQNTPAKVGGSSAAMAPLKDNLPSVSPGGLNPPVKPNPLSDLRNAVDKMANDKVKGALLTIIDAAGDDAIKARESIENWYNSAMDRVSGWYKRRVQQIVFFMGFGIAVIMNADTFAIFGNLVNDRPLRSAVVATVTDKKYSAADTSADSLRKNINKFNSLVELGLPIGWNWKSCLNPHAKSSNLSAIPMFIKENIPYSVLMWLLKIIGWFVTGLAVSLGAPFWFDVLNRIMVVRSTVKPTEKSPDEGSQDRHSKS